MVAYISGFFASSQGLFRLNDYVTDTVTLTGKMIKGAAKVTVTESPDADEPPMDPLLKTVFLCQMLREYIKSYRFVFLAEAIISSIADNKVLTVTTKFIYICPVEKHYICPLTQLRSKNQHCMLPATSYNYKTVITRKTSCLNVRAYCPL